MRELGREAAMAAARQRGNDGVREWGERRSRRRRQRGGSGLTADVVVRVPAGGCRDRERGTIIGVVTQSRASVLRGGNCRHACRRHDEVRVVGTVVAAISFQVHTVS